MKILTSILVASGSCMTVLSQSHLVIPSAYTSIDANGLASIPGATLELREQTIVGAAHLTQLIGKQLTAIEFRRNATSTNFDAGAAQLAISISSMMAPTYDCSRDFALNVSANVVQVFNGQVTLPASPAAAGPSIAWTATNTIKVVFQTPFHYNGGRLCIDMNGSAVPGLEAENWIADARAEDARGIVQNIGGGCGNYMHHAYVDEYGLVVGSAAKFTTLGTPDSFSFAMTGHSGPSVPLGLLGFAPPGNCSLMLSTLDIVEPVALTDILNPTIGYGSWLLDLPNNSALQGLGFTTQWFDWATQATTDALTWTIGSAPSLDMATIEGDSQSASGRIAQNIAHVMRIEYQ